MTSLPPHVWHNAWTIFCDFDGTICPRDVTDTLLEHFGQPGWESLEERWLAGNISARECMAGQVALLDMSREDLDELLATMPLDPDFGRFVALASRYGIPLHIVSDGLDYPIYRLLELYGVSDIPVVASLLQQTGARHWQLGFPWRQPQCTADSGVCKCAVMHQRAHNLSLLIGDGRSDFCLARHATHVFARGALLDECRSRQLSHTPVSNFSEACARLRTLLGEPETRIPAPHFNPLIPWSIK